MTAVRTRLVLTALTAVCLGATMFIGTGSVSRLARSEEFSLRFVGNLINGAQNISLDRLDPTCPQCK